MNHPPGPPLPPPPRGPGGPGDPRGPALYPHVAPPPPGMGPPPAPGYPPPPPRLPDPGSRTGALVAKLILIPLLLLVAAVQQYSIYSEQPEEPREEAIQAPDMSDNGLLVTRLFLKMARAWPALAGHGEPLKSMDLLWEGSTDTPGGDSEREWKIAARSRVDECRAAIVAGETNGPDEAIARLNDLEQRLAVDQASLLVLAVQRLGEEAGDVDWTEPDAWKRLGGADGDGEESADSGESGQEEGAARGANGAEAGARPNGPEDTDGADDADLDDTDDLVEILRDSGGVLGALTRDAALLERHYRAVRGDEATPPDTDDWDRLESHHGWFAQLARIARRDQAALDTPERAALLAGGERLLTMIGAACMLVGVVLVGMAAASIWLIVMLSMRRLRFWFVPPVPGGSVYLETVAAFVLMFLGTQVLTSVLAMDPDLRPRMIEIAMGVQWLVLLVIFWPLLRGVSFPRWRRDLGLIAPRGVVREIAAGFVGYLAGLPLVIAAGIIGFILKTVQDRVLADRLPYTTGGNPVLEMVTTGGVLQLVLFLSVATIWAPLVEEMIFRGCLYRHLRSRVVFLLAGPLSALAFGIMHGYELVLLGPVIALGATFAFVREWRGSLVGPIVMHALHNGTLLVLVVTLVRIA